MNWTERLKLAWKIFKREALPLYAWTLIYVGVGVVLVIALLIGVAAQLRWALPQSYGGYFSPGMPIPGVPPTSGMPVPGMPPNPGISPFPGPFGFHSQNPFGYFNGSMGNLSMLLSALASVAGTLILIMIVAWLMGTAFYTGLYNLTAKAYREHVTLKDFSYAGFFRVLGWQGIILLVQALLVIVGIIGAISLRNFNGALIAFFIIYGLFIIAVGIFVLPWLCTSAIYLLAHRRDNFRKAFADSWRFFRRHMGILWGYIGTVFLFEIGLQVLNRIASGLGGLAALVVSPFIAVLAIVWVLSLEDNEFPESNTSLGTPAFTPSVYPYPDTNLETPSERNPISETDPRTSAPLDKPPLNRPIAEESTFKGESPKINLQKSEEEVQSELVLESDHRHSEDRPNFCPSCGRANTGTAYCPQCGTKL